MAEFILIILAPIIFPIITPTPKAIPTNLRHAHQPILKASTLIIPTAILSLTPTPLQLNLAKLRASTRWQAIPPFLAITSQAIQIKRISIQKIMQANRT